MRSELKCIFEANLSLEVAFYLLKRRHQRIMPATSSLGFYEAVGKNLIEIEK